MNNSSQVDRIKEMLQALMLTYEEPTLVELAVLAGFSSDEEGINELRELVGRCTSFLTLEEDEDAKVKFRNTIVKPHLVRNANSLLGVSEEEVKWLHGELALRSFSHLMERFDIPDSETKADPNEEEEEAHSQHSDEDHAGKENEGEDHKEEESEEEDTNEDEEENEEDSDNDSDEEGEDSDEDSDDDEEMAEPDIAALPYMVKHWLHHASKSTTE